METKININQYKIIESILK